MATGPSSIRDISRRQRGTVLVVASACIGVLVALASSLGLFAAWPYQHETANWVLQARGQDIGNLAAIIVLLASAVRMRAGSRTAAQVWTGTLLYFLYAFVIYAFAVHFGRLFVVYVAVLGLVFYTFIVSLPSTLDRRVAASDAARRFAAWVLIGTGGLFALLWLGELVPATVTGQAPPSLGVAGLIVNPVHVIDLSVVLPGMVAIGVLALRRDDTGLALAVPALVFSVLMGSSIIAAMALIVAADDMSGLVPMVMVMVIVGASLIAAIAFARSRPDTVDDTT